MATAELTLDATTREKLGSREARRLRESGRMPAVLYGHKQDPESVAVDAAIATRFIEQGEKVLTLQIDGSRTETVLIKDLQFNYLGSEIIHIDLERVNLDEVVTTHVHLVFKGEMDAPGIKVAGAIMMHPTTEIAVKCKVRDIIEHVEVDVSEMEAGSNLHASDVVLPEGLALENDADTVIASITAPKLSSTDAEEGEAAGEGAEPEVISERKSTEDGKD